MDLLKGFDNMLKISLKGQGFPNIYSYFNMSTVLTPQKIDTMSLLEIVKALVDNENKHRNFSMFALRDLQ